MAEPKPSELVDSYLEYSHGDEHVVGEAVVAAFNPPDEDMAFEHICVEAIKHAADFIAEQPCGCDLEADDGEPCDRCFVLGRCYDKALER